MCRPFCVWIACLVALALGARSAQAQGVTAIDPEKADADFSIQGEYVGQLQAAEGAKKYGVQVIALGKGQFRAVGYHGGLPGDGWDRQDKVQAEGRSDNGAVRFRNDEGSAVLQQGVLTVFDAEGNQVGQLERVLRQSPTLGKKPPPGAVVLFDGQDADQWQNGRITEEGLLMEGTTSKPTFGSHQVHIEFLLPYQPEARGQGRGNSGIYVQGRYEVQMLDSFGLQGQHNECGGIYSVKDPDLNMCFPPLSWQTYDIQYTAARYDDQGKLVDHPRMTVHHNGVRIHDDVELPGERSTTAAPLGPGAEPGPIYLQDHGSPVRYRNVWVVESD